MLEINNVEIVNTPYLKGTNPGINHQLFDVGTHFDIEITKPHDEILIAEMSSSNVEITFNYHDRAGHIYSKSFLFNKKHGVLEIKEELLGVVQ